MWCVDISPSEKWRYASVSISQNSSFCILRSKIRISQMVSKLNFISTLPSPVDSSFALFCFSAFAIYCIFTISFLISNSQRVGYTGARRWRPSFVSRAYRKGCIADCPRNRPSMVRKFGDHEVVWRFVAQRGLCIVHELYFIGWSELNIENGLSLISNNDFKILPDWAIVEYVRFSVG